MKNTASLFKANGPDDCPPGTRLSMKRVAKSLEVRPEVILHDRARTRGIVGAVVPLPIRSVVMGERFTDPVFLGEATPIVLERFVAQGLVDEDLPILPADPTGLG